MNPLAHRTIGGQWRVAPFKQVAHGARVPSARSSSEEHAD